MSGSSSGPCGRDTGWGRGSPARPGLTLDLKLVSQRELHGARVQRPLELTKCLRRLQTQARVGEIRMVESVERLGPKLNPLPFPRQAECLRNRHVDVKDWRQTNRGPGPCALRRLIDRK